MSKKYTLENLLEDGKKIHGDKIGYEKTIYNGYNKKSIFICNVCKREFEQNVNNHLRGQGCAFCSKRIKVNNETFLLRAKELNGDDFDYNEIDVNGTKCSIWIRHKKCGHRFKQQVGSHLRGIGCPKCAGKDKTIEEIIDTFKKVHGNKFGYHLIIEYKNSRQKLPFFCFEHGIFYQTRGEHLSGCGCRACSGHEILTTENFKEKVKPVHGDTYIYDETEIKGNKIKAKFKYRKHGPFWQTPNNHLSGVGCPKCQKNCKLTNESFTERSKLINEDKYLYDRVNIINGSVDVLIGCIECNEYFLQKPYYHLRGNGCQKCSNSNNVKENILLNIIKSTFSVLQITPQYRPLWLKSKITNGSQSLDIYLPEYNIAIEHHGKQHFKPIEFFGGKYDFDKIRERDERKFNLCLQNDCKLLYFTYKKSDVPKDWHHTVYTKEEDLIIEIKRLIDAK